MFGDRLKQLREEHKLTQEQLGERAGIHGRMIQKYELRLTSPSVDKAAKLAQILNTTVDYLVGIANEESPEWVNEKLTSEERELIFALRSKQTDRAVRAMARITRANG